MHPRCCRSVAGNIVGTLYLDITVSYSNILFSLKSYVGILCCLLSSEEKYMVSAFSKSSRLRYSVVYFL